MLIIATCFKKRIKEHADILVLYLFNQIFCCCTHVFQLQILFKKKIIIFRM